MIEQVVPPHWAADAPKDTCGAGDAYAAGVLWAYLRGMGVAAMGRAGARVASQVRSEVAVHVGMKLRTVQMHMSSVGAAAQSCSVRHVMFSTGVAHGAHAESSGPIRVHQLNRSVSALHFQELTPCILCCLQVISRQGATLTMEGAAALAQSLPAAEASPALSSLSSADMW